MHEFSLGMSLYSDLLCTIDVVRRRRMCGENCFSFKNNVQSLSFCSIFLCLWKAICKPCQHAAYLFISTHTHTHTPLHIDKRREKNRQNSTLAPKTLVSSVNLQQLKNGIQREKGQEEETKIVWRWYWPREEIKESKEEKSISFNTSMYPFPTIEKR